MDLELAPPSPSPSSTAVPAHRERPADHPAAPTVPLARGATLALTLPRGARIAVASGRVWITEPGDLDDHFIEAGREHRVARGGRVVIEGDSAAPARVRLVA